MSEKGYPGNKYQMACVTCQFLKRTSVLDFEQSDQDGEDHEDDTGPYIDLNPLTCGRHLSRRDHGQHQEGSSQ